MFGFLGSEKSHMIWLNCTITGSFCERQLEAHHGIEAIWIKCSLSDIAVIGRLGQTSLMEEASSVY